MSQMVVLGTWHDIQGAQKRTGRRLDDTEYKKVLERLLPGRDFVFEEATGLGPTTAAHLALDRIGAGHYLDVDPALAERWAYGISEQTGVSVPINPGDLESECCNSERVEDQSRRECVWLQRIQEKTFESGLLVCGFLHVLSMSFRLVEAGYAVEAHHYTPWQKFCQRPHVPARKEY
jgi:hypothetical protein